MNREPKPEIENYMRLAKYRVLGQPLSGMGSVWFYGSHHSAEKAILRLRYLGGTLRRGLRGVKIKLYRYADTPKRAGHVRFWIESESEEVTRRLLSQFIHDPSNEKNVEMIEWATEEIMRRETR